MVAKNPGLRPLLYSALSVQDARFYHPTFRPNRRGEWLPTICRFGDSRRNNGGGLLVLLRLDLLLLLDYG